MTNQKDLENRKLDFEIEKMRLENSIKREEINNKILSEKSQYKFQVIKWAVATFILAVGAITSFLLIDLQEQKRQNIAERREWLKEYLNASETENVLLWARKLSIIKAFSKNDVEMMIFVKNEEKRIEDKISKAKESLSLKDNILELEEKIEEKKASSDIKSIKILENTLNEKIKKKEVVDAYLIKQGIPSLPNILEVSIERKPSRSISDLRSIKIALESYMIDNDSYPIPINPDKYGFGGLSFIDSNQRYILSNQAIKYKYWLGKDKDRYIIVNDTPGLFSSFPWRLFSRDRNPSKMEIENKTIQYDPTNGTTSKGILIHFGGMWETN